MYEITLRSVPLLFDAEDAEQYETLEFALAVMAETEQKLAQQKKDNSVPFSVVLRGYCMMYRTFFNDVFGEGTADKIFQGEKMKPSVYEETYLAFLDALMMQKAAIADKKQERWNKYSVRKPESHAEPAV